MATVHSLPTELIRHTLSLAYPPGKKGSYGGLGQTSSVHKSWLGPSRSVMTEVLRFGSEHKQSLALFVEKGPTGFSSQIVELCSAPEQDIRAFLAKAKAGGIVHLTVSVTNKHVIRTLFNFSALDELRSFTLRVNNHARLSVEQIPVIQWDSWPKSLVGLAISSPTLPVGLFQGSQNTLTTLELDWPKAQLYGQLNSLKSCFPQVTTLTSNELTPATSLGLSSHVTTFVTFLPRLSHLTLIKLWPHQLEQLLAALTPAQKLVRLMTKLWHPVDSARLVGKADQGRATDEWQPALCRCASLPALKGVRNWALSRVRLLQRTPMFSLGRPAQLMNNSPAEEVYWSALRAAVAAAGIELVLGPDSLHSLF